MSAPGDVCVEGCLPRGRLPGECLCRRASTWGCTHPPVNRMTDRCKIITLSQTSFVVSNEQVSSLNIWGPIQRGGLGPKPCKEEDWGHIRKEGGGGHGTI